MRKPGSLSTSKSQAAMDAGVKDARRLIEEREASDEDAAESYALGVMLGAYVKTLLTWGIDPAFLQTLTGGKK